MDYYLIFMLALNSKLLMIGSFLVVIYSNIELMSRTRTLTLLARLGYALPTIALSVGSLKKIGTIS